MGDITCFWAKISEIQPDPAKSTTFSKETLPRLWEQTIGPQSTFFVEMVVFFGPKSPMGARAPPYSPSLRNTHFGVKNI